MKSIATTLLLLLSLSSYAQFSTLDSLSNYLEGTWQLKSHYYSIAGITDTFPTLTENYQFVFSKVSADSTLRIDAFNNFESLKVEQATIRPAFNNWDRWMIDVLPSVFEGWTWFPMIISDHYSTQDTMLLSDNISDGSSLVMIRVDNSSQVTNLEKPNGLSLFPNPVISDFVFIDDEDLKNKTVNVSISDASGQLIYGISNHIVGAGLLMTNCPSGLLVITLESEGKIYTDKIINLH